MFFNVTQVLRRKKTKMRKIQLSWAKSPFFGCKFNAIFYHFQKLIKALHLLSFFTKVNKTQQAFTLAELLTATLVISIIMVALAPVITRRAHDNVAITVNQKQGLEIFATPGIYSFDVPVGINTLFIQGAGGGGGGGGAIKGSQNTKTFTSSQDFKIPIGVNQVTFTITGAGGGGGGSNGSVISGTHSMSSLISLTSCNADDFHAIRGASDESDLCITKENIDIVTKEGTGVIYGSAMLERGQTCTSNNCCWKGAELECSTISEGYSGCNRSVCTLPAASQVCQAHYGEGRDKRNIYRLPNFTELQKISKYFLDWSYNAGLGGIKLCSHNDNYPCPEKNDMTTIPACSIHANCPGASDNYCNIAYIWASDGRLMGRHHPCDQNLSSQGVVDNNSASVRCVRPIKYYNNFGGAGGASGAQYTRTINVLPDDILTLTIGTGGAGGSAKNKGTQGGTTQILHKRNGSTIGTYYVKGGLGGNPATTTANGSAYGNGTASGQTTVSGTCYANGAVGCSVLSYSGNAGSSTHGGNGGRVNNSGTITDGGASSGGYIYVDSARTANQRYTTTEQNKAKGQGASTAGWGGGGGLTPTWADSTSHFYAGGAGANGKIEIKYTPSLPGGGGGSGARIGGDVVVSSETKLQEMHVRVTEGARLVVKIGSGGSGGVAGQNGSNGEATVIGDNEIVFFGGEGGKVASSSLTTGGVGGSGGRPGIVNQNDALETHALGIKSTGALASGLKYTKTESDFKGRQGKTGGKLTGSSYNMTGAWAYGFSGGSGGAPYGIKTSGIKPSISCGGGMDTSSISQNATLDAFVCTTGNINGASAKTHDPANNEYGGSGGGGGGVIGTSTEFGEGGNGASGYLRIRWNEAEQE